LATNCCMCSTIPFVDTGARPPQGTLGRDSPILWLTSLSFSVYDVLAGKSVYDVVAVES
jgi:hypothetical protein